MLAVIRTMQILNALSAGGEMGVIELSHSLGIHKADVSRILTTLENSGYVNQEPSDGKYRVTFEFIGLSMKYRDQTSLLDVVHPVLTMIAQEINELVQFAWVQGRDVIYIDKEESRKPLRAASMLGQTAPLHATAVGKVWLASLPADDVRSLMQQYGMSQITTNTITDIERLLIELKQIRRQGYALAHEEVNTSVVGLAVPVHDKSSLVRGSVVAAIPVYEASDGRLRELFIACKEGAEVLEERLQLIW